MPSTFAVGANSVTLSRDAELGNGETWGRIQARARTQDGEFIACDKDIDVRQFHLQYREMTAVDKAALESFVNDYAIGSTREVTFTDHNGDRWIVKFLNERLDFTEDWYSVAGRFRVSVDLEVIRQVTAS